jgi:hypothetical protein
LLLSGRAFLLQSEPSLFCLRIVSGSFSVLGHVDTKEMQQAIEHVIRSRRSVRAFKPDAVPQETLEHLLTLAARAPSGTNTQPWKVYVLQDRQKSACRSAYSGCPSSA